MDNNQDVAQNTKGDYKIWAPLVFAIATIIGLIGGYKMAGGEDLNNMIVKLDKKEKITTGRVEELIRFIESRYVYEVNSNELITDAFENILSHLDPHSVYLKPEEMLQLTNQMEGSFEGIGIESVLLDDTLHVSNILPGGPASKAGLSIGDQIIMINDSLVAGQSLSFSDIRARLKGEKYSKVKLSVKPFQSGPIKDIAVEINTVDIKTVDGFRYNDQLSVISIKRFSADSYREFMACLERLNAEGGFKDIIIDLRGNPGGYLPEATKILNQIFKEKGRLLVYTQGRNERVSEYKTTGKYFYDIDKVAILVDEGSASGSEIIAGAIQDWDRGLIVGRRTFGKGLVQEQYELSNGGALRLTVAKYFTPSGRLIQRSYEDMDSYDKDLYNRISSGELSGNVQVPVLDSTVFMTKIEKRIVYGSGGVSPDIYIPTDSLQYSKEMLHAKAFAGDFVFRKFKAGGLDIPSDKNVFLFDYEVPQTFINEYKNTLEYTENKFEWLDETLAIVLKEELAQLYFGNTVALEVNLRNDFFVDQSVNALAKENIFAELK